MQERRNERKERRGRKNNISMKIMIKIIKMITSFFILKEEVGAVYS